MKKYFLTLVLIFIGIFIFSSIQLYSNEGESKIIPKFQNENINITIKQSSVIDFADTVVFDLSKTVANGDRLEFPVSILSDDSVFSLDFALNFNQSKLKFDSVFDVANYLQSLFYYNSFDSTLRYTSSSFQIYGSDTPLVAIRFVTLAGYINMDDLININAYLNGASCSVKVINSIPALIENNNVQSVLNIFPNPAGNILNIISNENVYIQLLDINYGQLIFQTEISADQNFELITQNYREGIYFLKIFNGKGVSTKKIVVER